MMENWFGDFFGKNIPGDLFKAIIVKKAEEWGCTQEEAITRLNRQAELGILGILGFDDKIESEG